MGTGTIIYNQGTNNIIKQLMLFLLRKVNAFCQISAICTKLRATFGLNVPAILKVESNEPGSLAAGCRALLRPVNKY